MLEISSLARACHLAWKIGSFACCGLFILPVEIALGQSPAFGTVSGTMVAGSAGQPLEFGAVVLMKAVDGSSVSQATTDQQGRFSLADVAAGDYKVSFGYVGGETKETPPFTVSAVGESVDLGVLDVLDRPIQLQKMEVVGTQAAFLNSIDRKTYNVGKEIQSATGSASDLLQNIPSVQVDIDGGVSLRGSENVMILINGRTSTLMGKSRAEVLQQLPADGIEKIEVTTNPSAKYKPDGTAGIINIVLKQKRTAGLVGAVSANVGNDDRYNGGIRTSYNPGPYNIFANVSLRQDDRRRITTDKRTLVDSSGTVTTFEKKSEDHTRPLTRIGQTGVEYVPNEYNNLRAAVSYNYRTFVRHALDRNFAHASNGALASEFNRTREDPEFEHSLEVSTSAEHKFPQQDHTVKFEFKTSRTHEEEDNRYASRFRFPAQPDAYENTLIKNTGTETEAIVEYAYPINDHSRFEAGYTGTIGKFDADFFGEALDLVTGQWTPDTLKTNRFGTEQTIHAFYATYGRTIGRFGVLAGLRPEFAYVKSVLVTSSTTIPANYSRIYPSLHLAYKLTDRQEVQLNYSHRVQRPDLDDLNPFPEYTDPLNVRAGNPRLLPEDTHSVEAGYGFQGDHLNLTTAIYHRILSHGFTTVTRELGDGVLLTTRENLSKSQATGLETTANRDLGKNVTVNFSSNVYFNTIDASNFGYSASKSDVSWSAKIGGTLRLPRDTLMQVNTNYVSSRLTAQGSRRPSFVANVGLRKEIMDRKAALSLTISDVFNSQKDGYLLETPTLRQEISRRKSPRTIYVGMSYNFGKPSKKSKPEQITFDDAL
jgi:outer membrane receptor protein involved in Fe transport